MDYLEEKFSVFNRAIEMQATSFEEQIDIKEKEIYQTIEDFRMAIESEIKRRARSNNDFALESKKNKEKMEELHELIRSFQLSMKGIFEGLSCTMDSQLINC